VRFFAFFAANFGIRDNEILESIPDPSPRQYDATFKREAVANWLSSGKSAAVVALELGLSAKRLYAWRNLLDPAAAGGRVAAGSRAGTATDLQAQLEAAQRENRHLREQRDILKNVGHSLRTVAERLARVQAMKTDHSILQLCENLEVSPSGYYAWAQRQSAPGPRALEDQALATEVAAIHQQSRQTYGSPRIVAALRARGRRHGRRRIARLMQHAGLCGRQKGRYRVRTTDQPPRPPHRPQPPGRGPQGHRSQPDLGRRYHLHSHSGRLALPRRHPRPLQPQDRRLGHGRNPRRHPGSPSPGHGGPPPGSPGQSPLPFRPGRAIRGRDFRAALAQAHLVPSMSRRGNCYDHATRESFWSTLKLELVYRRDFATHPEARAAIFDYIEAFYNRERLHRTLDFLSPTAFELINN
jgi:transposase InsO family protein/transposase-like protein